MPFFTLTSILVNAIVIPNPVMIISSGIKILVIVNAMLLEQMYALMSILTSTRNSAAAFAHHIHAEMTRFGTKSFAAVAVLQSFVALRDTGSMMKLADANASLKNVKPDFTGIKKIANVAVKFKMIAAFKMKIILTSVVRSVPVFAMRQSFLAHPTRSTMLQAASASAHQSNAGQVSSGAKKTAFVFANQLCAQRMSILSLIKKTIPNADVLASLNYVHLTSTGVLSFVTVNALQLNASPASSGMPKNAIVVVSLTLVLMLLTSQCGTMQSVNAYA